MGTRFGLHTSSKPVVSRGDLAMGVTIEGPGWSRFAVLRVPLADLPLRQIIQQRAQEDEAPPPDLDDDPLPIDWA